MTLAILKGAYEATLHQGIAHLNRHDTVPNDLSQVILDRMAHGEASYAVGQKKIY